MATPPVLSDGVVLLRPPRPEDADDVALGCQDPITVQWTTVPSPYGLADAHDWIAQHGVDGPDGALRWWKQPTWAITAGDDRWLGSIGLRPDGADAAEVGYLVAPWARGRGLATRSLRLACRWGFSALHLRVVTWAAGVGNDASRAVAAKVGFRVASDPRRLGMAIRGQRMDCWVGDLLPEDLVEAAASRRRSRSGPRLTSRELQVLAHMAAGQSNRDIAAALGISENTVKNHVRKILEKLQARSRMEAVIHAIQRGLARLP